MKRGCRSDRRAARAGLTLVELLLAVGLASLLIVAVFRLLDVSLSLWSRGELRRGLVEQASGTAELLSRDLRAVHAGGHGDLLVQWVTFDADGDGLRERAWPRLRCVREASAAELERLRRAVAAAAPPTAAEAAAAPRSTAPASGLLEVAWAVLPAGGKGDGSEGVLWRGERELGTENTLSFFTPGFFDGSHLPPVGALNEVTGGVLWLGVQLATQTSIVHDGWEIGSGYEHATACWDAWTAARPDATLHAWNEAPVGVPRARDLPVLPRRVRIELEFERPQDRSRRTRLLAELDAVQTSFVVENGESLPKAGAFLLVDAEWMELVSVDGDRARVRRAARGTAPVPHDPGKLVHHGATVVTEVPIPVYNDDWNL